MPYASFLLGFTPADLAWLLPSQGTRSSSVFLYRHAHPSILTLFTSRLPNFQRTFTSFTSLPVAVTADASCCHHNNFQQLMNDAQQLQLYSSLIQGKTLPSVPTRSNPIDVKFLIAVPIVAVPISRFHLSCQFSSRFETKWLP